MASFLNDNADMMKLAVDDETSMERKKENQFELDLKQLANDVAGSMSHRSIRSTIHQSSANQILLQNLHK